MIDWIAEIVSLYVVVGERVVQEVSHNDTALAYATPLAIAGFALSNSNFLLAIGHNPQV